jgi:hypothetical protein
VGDSTALTQAGDRVDAPAGDTFAEGPVWIYPESLEVTLTSTDESWARVVSDGDTIFKSFLEPGDERTFRALTELQFKLGKYECVTGSVYGHPLKPMESFLTRGSASVTVRITKENWESLIDSTKARYARD